MTGYVENRLADDPILQQLREAQPVKRDRVRINSRGVAADEGKFDQVMVPAGTRFMFELAYTTVNADDDTWFKLLTLIHHPAFRPGGHTRTGLGALTILSSDYVRFDLTDPQQAQAYRQWPHQLSQPVTETLAWTPDDDTLNELSFSTITLSVQADDAMRIGQGRRGFKSLQKFDRQATAENSQGREKQQTHYKHEVARGLCQSEPTIHWHKSAQGEETGQLNEETDQFVLPGSAIKGPLAHRMDYYARCLHQAFVQAPDDLSGPQSLIQLPEVTSAMLEQEASQRHDAVNQLLGRVLPANTPTSSHRIDDADQDASQDSAQAGLVYIDDCYLPIPTVSGGTTTTIRHHNSIDRFTGGTRDGVLFNEELLWKPGFTVSLIVNTERYNALDDTTRQAFELALQDFISGDLPLGAGTSKGFGAVSGELTFCPRLHRALSEQSNNNDLAVQGETR